MNDPLQALQALLQPPGLQQTLFPSNSRYAGIGLATLVTPEGRTVAYLRRRFVPPPTSLATWQVHTVVEGDRLDKLAARYLGDPTQFWRLCDGNGAMRPDALTDTVGRRLRITLPPGIVGGDDGA